MATGLYIYGVLIQKLLFTCSRDCSIVYFTKPDLCNHAIKHDFKEHGESVPTRQVFLRHKFPNMGKMGHHFEKISSDYRASSYWSVHSLLVWHLMDNLH